MQNGFLVPEGTMKGLVAFKGNKIPLCSGTLITISKVLTSAHCIYLIYDFNGKAICWETAAYIEEVKFEIENTWEHSDYDFTARWKSYNFDLGLADVSLFIYFLIDKIVVQFY